MHGVPETDYTDTDHHDGTEHGRDMAAAAAAAAATATDTYLSHLDRTGRGRYGSTMPCYDPTAMDTRKKGRPNCDFALDEGGGGADTFAAELKEGHADRVAGTPSTPLAAATAAGTELLGRIKQEFPAKGYKSPTHSNAYGAAVPMSAPRDQPTFGEQLYMDASNNCWESLIHLRQKILRHKQRLQQEQTTKYYYDSHNKCTDGAAINAAAYGGDRYDASDRINAMVYGNERQHPYFDKMPSEPSGSYASRADPGYDKLMGDPSGTGSVPQPQPPPPPPLQSSSVPPTQLPQENIYGIMDFQQTDKLSNITRMMGANETAAGFTSLANYRKASATETSHSSSPLNESPSDCLSAAAYRDTMCGEAAGTVATAHPHMRKVTGFEKPMEKPCSGAAKGRDDEEFLKL